MAYDPTSPGAREAMRERFIDLFIEQGYDRQTATLMCEWSASMGREISWHVMADKLAEAIISDSGTETVLAEYQALKKRHAR